jgi:hypothetical protein
MNRNQQFRHVHRANKVFDLFESWLSNAEVVMALETEKNNFSSYDHKTYRLDVHATIAAFFLFYMITINNINNIATKNALLNNTRLVSAVVNSNDRLNLSATQQVKSMIECGFTIHNGFVWCEDI